MSELTFCSRDDILLSLFLTLSNCSTSGNGSLMQFLLEEPVFDEMFDAADPDDQKFSLASFGLLVSKYFLVFF